MSGEAERLLAAVAAVRPRFRWAEGGVAQMATEMLALRGLVPGVSQPDGARDADPPTRWFVSLSP